MSCGLWRFFVIFFVRKLLLLLYYKKNRYNSRFQKKKNQKCRKHCLEPMTAVSENADYYCQCPIHFSDATVVLLYSVWYFVFGMGNCFSGANIAVFFCYFLKCFSFLLWVCFFLSPGSGIYTVYVAEVVYCYPIILGTHGHTPAFGWAKKKKSLFTWLKYIENYNYPGSAFLLYNKEICPTPFFLLYVFPP